MVKDALRRAAQSGRHVASGFSQGLANSVSISGFHSPHFTKIEVDPNQAFARDWEKLGGDMRRAVEKVAPGGPRKK